MSLPDPVPPIFVISLVRDTERREAMKKALAGLNFQFFDAVDGRELDEAKYRHRMQPDWWRVMRGRRMSSGMIGCFLSHYALWEHLVETGTPYAIVFEDDTRLDDGFTAALEAVMAANVDWDVVLLSVKKRYAIDWVAAQLGAGRSLVRHRRRVGGGTRGYIIRLEAAQALLHYCWRIRAPMGWLHGEWWLSGLTYLAVEPAIVLETGLPSTIGTQHRVKRTATEYMAAALYKLADRLYRRAVRKSTV